MTKTLSNYMRNAVIDNDIKKIKRFLWLHKGNSGVINARTSFVLERCTLLTLAIRLGRPQIVALLVACPDVDVNAVDFYLNTPLMNAASVCNVTAIHALFSRSDLTPEAINFFHHDTALFAAARHGNEEAVKALLDYGVNKNHTALNGRTAAQEAAAYGRKELAELITTYQSKQLIEKKPEEKINETSSGRFWQRGNAAALNHPAQSSTQQPQRKGYR